ncbi:GntR family transcriptional regulator [Brevibacillus massiliensis]|jgi:DNA-binding GntR family transcriptional regulator|uniref:GntR family transcriptional regulator n=1 Tax=Brevibacillus massiliensis TaxID=1118054 RepID=UPI0002E782C0|nr:GntR family transcriptional regulator [Brevibacillus massiliensis]
MSRQMEFAYQFIKERILNGTYRPSQKLVESQLSEIIGVSRNTVKTALLKLEQENLVIIENNKGATIKSFTIEEVKNYLEIREVLEGLIIRSAVPNFLEDDLNHLEQILSKMENYLCENNYDEYTKLNIEFHDTIYKLAKNIQAVKMVNMIKTQLIRYHFRTILVPGRNEKSLQEHKNIYQALKERDALGAEEAMKHHVANVRKTIEENYQYLI